MTDRREDLGLDPDGVVETWCPSCKQMVAVSTRVTDGTRHESCEQCGHSFGSFVAGSFEPAESYDL